MVDAFVESHESAPEEIVLDLDATDDPIHGQQEGRFFHGYYRHYCYLPLYIFSGEHLLCARLRCSNIDGPRIGRRNWTGLAAGEGFDLDPMTYWSSRFVFTGTELGLEPRRGKAPLVGPKTQSRHPIPTCLSDGLQ